MEQKFNFIPKNEMKILFKIKNTDRIEHEGILLKSFGYWYIGQNTIYSNIKCNIKGYIYAIKLPNDAIASTRTITPTKEQTYKITNKGKEFNIKN